MHWKYMFVAIVHFTCVAVVLRVLGLILPCCISGIYSCAGNFMMFLIVARLTFSRFTKRKHLSDRLQPENRAVLITGCDSGFGQRIAQHLDSQGFHVFASCLKADGPGATHLLQSCSKRLQILKLDVTSDESVQKALTFVKENLGTSELWCLVNNAGIQKGCSLELTSIEDFKECLEVNTLGPIRVTKAFLPLLRQSRGRIVNINSLLGRMPLPHCEPYAVSKRALVAFNDCLRQELDPWGIRVLSVEPEFFETEMTKGENLSKTIVPALDENVKADYGDKYLSDFLIYAEYFTRFATNKYSRVMDAVEDAVSMEYPSPQFRPSRNCAVKCAIYIYELLPHMVKDIMVKTVLFVTGFPKPKEANYVSYP